MAGAVHHVPDDGASEVTIHSSWRGIILSFVGACVVVLVGSFAVAVNGARVVPVAILAFGVVLVVGAAYDYPIASTFDGDRVVRRTMLRAQVLPWDRVMVLTRTRPNFVASRRGQVSGGLVAVVGRRRYLLTDHVESLGEHLVLVRLLEDRELGVYELMRPADDVTPTWLYRRKRWRPESAR